MKLASFPWTIGLGAGFAAGVVTTAWSENLRLDGNTPAGDILLVTSGLIALLAGIILDMSQRRKAARTQEVA